MALIGECVSYQAIFWPPDVSPLKVPAPTCFMDVITSGCWLRYLVCNEHDTPTDCISLGVNTINVVGACKKPANARIFAHAPWEGVRNK